LLFTTVAVYIAWRETSCHRARRVLY